MKSSARSEPFLTSPLRMVLFLMSELVTAPVLMSPESTVFLPGSATAVPAKPASSATNATAMGADGRLM